jgi:hypothetical protein
LRTFLTFAWPLGWAQQQCVHCTRRDAPAFRAACARLQDILEGDFAAAAAYAAVFEEHRALHSFAQQQQQQQQHVAPPKL